MYSVGYPFVLSILFVLKSDRALADAYPACGMRVHITFDGNVYSDSFHKTAVVDGVFQPTLLLCAIRIGIESIHRVYFEALKATLQMPQSVGVAG